MSNSDVADKNSESDSILENAPKLIKLVVANDVPGAENLLILGEASVHDTDSTGMTALMHAAYKGYTDMSRMLIKQGSDVNADSHSHQYHPLHFAALSSSLDTVQLLLDHGAKTYKTNSLGRTAVQMAGFVGQTSCVALINNHIDRSELKRYTQPQSELQTTRLDPEAEQPLYEFMMQINLHPVHLLLCVGRSPALLRHLRPAAAVLDHLSVAETKRSSNVNEVLSLKFHYLACLLRHVAIQLEKDESEKNDEQKTSTDEKGCSPVVEPCIKQFLRCRASDGGEVIMELWIRDAIKSFHCLEMPLFLQVVRNVSGQDIQALTVLNGAINGQRAFAGEDDQTACAACGQPGKGNKSCAKCKCTYYCDRYCQKLHWSSHKKFCEKLRQTAGPCATQQDKENLATETSSN